MCRDLHPRRKSSLRLSTPISAKRSIGDYQIPNGQRGRSGRILPTLSRAPPPNPGSRFIRSSSRSARSKFSNGFLAKVTAIEKRGDQYQVIVQISPKYRGSFNTLAFGEIKPHSGSLKDGRLDLVYYQNPGLNPTFSTRRQNALFFGQDRPPRRLNKGTGSAK